MLYIKQFFYTLVSLILIIFLVNLFIGGWPPISFFRISWNEYRYYNSPKYDQRTISEVLIDNKGYVFPFIPLITIKSNHLSPEGLHKNATIVNCNESGTYSYFDSDIHGLRNQNNSHYLSSDIVLVGDSFAMGSCINAPDDIASRLKILTNKKILNLGQNGLAPLSELYVLKSLSPKKFKYLIWFYFEGNDTEIDTNHEMLMKVVFNKKPILYSSDIANSQFTNSFEHQVTYNHSKKLLSSLSDSLRGITGLYRYFNPSPAYFFDEKLLANIFSEAISFSKSRSAEKFIFVYIPAWERYTLNKEHPNVRAYHLLENKVTDIARNSNFDVISFSNHIDNNITNGLDYYYLGQSHLNIYGYNQLAKMISAKIN